MRPKAMRGTVWISACLLALTLSIAHPPSVAAEDNVEGSEEYREYVRAALSEFQAGNLNEAKAFFAQAHALSPSARTFRGLGMCSFEMRNYVDAIDQFEESLSSTNRPLTPAMRTEIAGLLRQARTFVTRIQVTTQPTWAKLRVDGRPAERDANGAISVDPGTHELVVEAADYDTVTRTLRTSGSEQLPISITLTPQRTLEAQAETRAPVAPAVTQPAETETQSSGSVVPWIVIGASVAVAATGAALLAVALSNKATVEKPEGNRPRYDRAADDRVLPFSAIGIAALAVGGAGLVAGIVWKASEGGKSEEAPSAQLEIQPTGVRVRGSF
jgi:tetratricopeptide (TPR) repeat protein